MKKQFFGISLALLLAGGAFAAAKPEQIPADAKGVILYQAKAFLNSPFFKAMEAKMPAPEGMEEQMGLSTAREIKEATAFFNEKWAAIFIEVPGKAEEFAQKMISGDAKKTIAGKSALVNADGQSAVVVLNANELLFAGIFEGDQVESAAAYLLNPKTPRLAANAPLAAVLKAKPNQYLYGAVADVNKMLATFPGFKEGAAGMPGIESVQRIVLALTDADQGGIRLMTKLVADTPEHGEQIQEALLGVKAMMGMAAAQMPALNPLLKNFTVKQNAAVTDLAITVRVADIEAIMGAIIPMMMMGQGGEMTITDEQFMIP